MERAADTRNGSTKTVAKGSRWSSKVKTDAESHVNQLRLGGPHINLERRASICHKKATHFPMPTRAYLVMSVACSYSR